MAIHKAVRVYADTSVFGGVFDSEFARASRLFFAAVRQGRLRLATSSIVEEELTKAPSRVRLLFNELLPWMERLPVSEDAITMRQAYIAAGIVTQQSVADALHVAVASTNDCEILVSWNCRHIVHFEKIPRYNAVNRYGVFERLRFTLLWR
jgi:predicted nucleic acid-binding protein